MSLFPAYTEGANSSDSDIQQTKTQDENWLANPSFNEFKPETADTVVISDKSSEENAVEKSSSSKSAKKRKKHKREKKRSPEPRIEFTGNEEYYVDKTPAKGYMSVNKLHKPACPRYRTNVPVLGFRRNNLQKSNKRYYTKLKSLIGEDVDPTSHRISLSDEEFGELNKELNKKLARCSRDIDLWLTYIKHQDNNPARLTKTQLAERKMDIIEKALFHNLGNEKLYKTYVDIVDSTFPSFEVSKYLDKLIAKDPTNYILWSAQILATQGSMARCVVPDVLKLYEECMQKMYRKSQEDEIMLKLFTNCALFLRQCGLSEQFFALIRLALELNVSVDKFSAIQPTEKDQQLLVEYEEVILKSGLPMNEIWLRIEKLRQNFNFIPCPQTMKCNDPQRIVYNEDICYFIYPMSHKENVFPLIIIILKLLKIPFLSSSSLRNRFIFRSEYLIELDSLEDILAVCLHQTTNLSSDSEGLDLILYELAKDTIAGPSFLSVSIGYEIYLNAVTDVLLTCAECFTEDERKRTIFVLLWLRFERILVILNKFASKLSLDYVKKVKSKIKNMLKREENRNVLNFYTEYAMLEVELGNMHVAENIFVTSISEGSSEVPNADFCTAYVTYAEVLLKEGNPSKAIKVLTCYALNIPITQISEDIVTEPKKLLAHKKLTERLNDLVFIEKNVEIMELEQYFLPDYLISLLKAKVYYQILINAKLEAMAFLENILRHFSEDNSRHSYLREHIFEFYVRIIQSPDKTCTVSNLLIYETISRGLKEFPENLYMLRTCASLYNQSWYKIRRLLTQSKSPVSVIFLVAAARYRFSRYHCQSEPQQLAQLDLELTGDMYSFELAYKRRVGNVLKEAIGKTNPLRKNSLMWRLYLRSLADVQASFESSRNALFTALDECPWNKALYLDGSVFVPKELSQLQDLMIEKQLRIYALPEELEILRNDTFETPKDN